MSKWTPKEENILKTQYQYLTDDQLSALILAQLGIERTPKAIEHRRKALGLRKLNAAQQNQAKSSTGFFAVQRNS